MKFVKNSGHSGSLFMIAVSNVLSTAGCALGSVEWVRRRILMARYHPPFAANDRCLWMGPAWNGSL